MVAKPYIDGNTPNRAGVPLARSQRLAKRAGEETGRGAPVLITLTVASAIAIGGAGYFYGQPGEAGIPKTEQMAEMVAAIAPPVATPIDTPLFFADAVEDAPADVELAAVDLSAPDMEALIQPEVAEPITAQAISYTPPAGLAPCVARIEDRLNALHGVANVSTDWDTKRDSIRVMAQATLDCDMARMQLDGDIELAASGFASLRVEWDRDDAALNLKIVDSVSQDAQVVAYSDDGLPVEFLID
ncbi:hypothetical protein ACG74X_19140 [Marivita sp. S0852]|uniref:hypothetical protein n=1 Tax=Marivita sp. S0852 TaxID=3373893 RepID=UPI0039823D8F